MRRRSATTTGERYGKPRRPSFPTARRSGKFAAADICSELGSSRAEYFSMSAAWSRRTTRCWCAKHSSSCRPDMKLALIGDAPYASEYIARVRDTRDPRVVIPGAIYGEGYHELQSHCFAYIHATEVGGTHPALIEAMGRGALTLYPGHAGESRGGRRCRDPIHALRPDSEIGAHTHVQRGRSCDSPHCRRKRVHQKYSWDAVTSAYESLLSSML